MSVMLPNTPAMLEAHYGVPMTGAVLHSINTRLDAAIIAFQLDHAGSKILIVDREFTPVIRQALELAKNKPMIIDYNDVEFPQDNEPLSFTDYEEFVATGDPNFNWRMPENEWEAISLNYTSGTTGNPKGVVYHHRGAALMSYSNTVATGMGQHATYLWTLPMFHLQRLVLPMVPLRCCWHTCLFAVGAGKSHLRCHCRPQGHKPFWRADCDGDAARRA